jgi:hypothetical protein
VVAEYAATRCSDQVWILKDRQFDPLAVFGIIDPKAVQLAVHGFGKLLKSLKMRE